MRGGRFGQEVVINFIGRETVSKAAKDAKGALADINRELQRAIGPLGSSAVGLPIITAMTAGVKVAMDFSMRMAEVRTVTHSSTQEIQALGDQVRQLSKEVPQGTDTLARGLYDISSSGFGAKDAMQILEVSARGATAGLTDTATSARVLTAVLNAYGMTAKDSGQVMDVLAKGVEVGVFRFEDLAGSLGEVIGTAALSKISIQEVVGAMATMTKQGLSAAEASVALNAVLRQILSPQEQTIKLAKQLGIEWSLSALQAKGLAGFMADLSAKTGGNAEVMAKLIPEIRGMRGAAFMASDGAKMLKKDIDAVTNSAGAMAGQFGIMMDEPAKKVTLLKNQLHNLAIETGATLAPAVGEASEALGYLVESQTSNIILAGKFTLALYGISKASAAATVGLAALSRGGVAALNPLATAVAAIGFGLGAIWDYQRRASEKTARELELPRKANLEMSLAALRGARQFQQGMGAYGGSYPVTLPEGAARELETYGKILGLTGPRDIKHGAMNRNLLLLSAKARHELDAYMAKELTEVYAAEIRHRIATTVAKPAGPSALPGGIPSAGGGGGRTGAAKVRDEWTAADARDIQIQIHKAMGEAEKAWELEQQKLAADLSKQGAPKTLIDTLIGAERAEHIRELSDKLTSYISDTADRVATIEKEKADEARRREEDNYQQDLAFAQQRTEAWQTQERERVSTTRDAEDAILEMTGQTLELELRRIGRWVEYYKSIGMDPALIGEYRQAAEADARRQDAARGTRGAGWGWQSTTERQGAALRYQLSSAGMTADLQQFLQVDLREGFKQSMRGVLLDWVKGTMSLREAWTTMAEDMATAIQTRLLDKIVLLLDQAMTDLFGKYAELAQMGLGVSIGGGKSKFNVGLGWMGFQALGPWGALAGFLGNLFGLDAPQEDRKVSRYGFDAGRYYMRGIRMGALAGMKDVLAGAGDAFGGGQLVIYQTVHVYQEQDYSRARDEALAMAMTLRELRSNV